MASFADDSRMMKKPLPKSLLLKDHLLNDMSSCSSNGFRSYPRRQCCTTVRFLVENDLNRKSKQPPCSIVESKMMSKSKPSVLQRASAVLINAFKHFPFAGAGNSSRKPNFLPRKLLKHGLWKKTDHHNNEIKRLKSFGDVIKVKETSSPESSTTTTAEMSSSTSNSNSESWSDSATTGNSSEINFAENDVVDENKKMTSGKRVGATTPTTQNAKKKWQNEQEEHSSPVSVMDFPYDDNNDVDNEEEDEVSSLFQHMRLEGAKKLMHKTRRFEGVPQLEPVRLEDRIALSVLEATYACYKLKEEGSQSEKKAMELLQLMKSTNSKRFSRFEAIESLLLGFFEEEIIEENISDFEMLQMARGWMNDQAHEMFLCWESQMNRQTYIREMEKRVKWSKNDDEVEIKYIGLELEDEVFTSLVDDILLDFHF